MKNSEAVQKNKQVFIEQPCSLNKDATLQEVDSSKIGITQEEVEKRLAEYGLNKLPQISKINY